MTDGVLERVVPLSSYAGSTIRIRFRGSVDGSANTLFRLDDVNVTAVTVTSPNGSENWAAGTTHAITWTISGNTNNINYYKIALSTDAGANYSTDLTPSGLFTPTARSWDWAISSSLNTTQARIRVRPIDVDQYVLSQDGSDANFTVSTAPTQPAPQLVSVSGIPSTMTVGQTFTVTINAANNGGDAGSGSAINASIRYNDGSDEVLVTSPSASWSDSLLNYEPSQTPIYDSSCNSVSGGAADHLVEAVDNSWLSGESHALSFTVRPQKVGTLQIRTRVTLHGSGGTCNYTNAPAAVGGSVVLDQQTWPAQQYSVTVNESADVLHQWAGMSSTGNQPVPPDPNGCAGPYGVLQAVNWRMAYYSPAGGLTWGTTDLTSFWSDITCSGYIADPKAIYDLRSGRFFIIMQENCSDHSYLHVAVSRSANPTSSGSDSWIIFPRVDMTEASGGLNYGGDYPGLGVDDKALYVTYNMFQLVATGTHLGSYHNCQVIALDKSALINGSVVTKRYFTDTSLNLSALQPATPVGNLLPGNVVYFGEADINSDIVRLWTLNDPLGNGTLSYQSFASGNGGRAPDSAPQPGGTFVDTVSDKTQGYAFWRNNEVWFCSTSGGSSGKAKVYYYRVNTSSLSLTEATGIDGGLGVWTYQPAIHGNAQGDTCLVYCQSSVTENPTIMYTRRAFGSSSFDPPSVLKQSVSPNNATDSRWGDYASVSVSPSDGSFWITNEWVQGSGANYWSTYWGHLASKTGLTTRSLSFSVSGVSGNPVIQLSPADNGGWTDTSPGTVRTYNDQMIVQATAPASFNGGTFVRWRLNGSDQTTSTSFSFSMNQNRTLEAVYFSKTDQSISFGALNNKTYGDPSFTISATASSGLPVSFSVVSGPATISGNTTVNLTGAGAVTIQATQDGDSNYNPSTPVPQSFTVAKANQSITFSPLPNRSIGEPAFTVSASASSGLQVGFSIASGPATVSGSDTINLTGTGTVMVRASQNGDINYNAASDADQPFTVYPPPTLNLVRSGGSVVITWPTNVAGFTLEGATNLVPVISWTSIFPLPVVVNAQNTVTNSAVSGNEFYRLRK